MPPDPRPALTERELFDLVRAAHRSAQPLPGRLEWVSIDGERQVVYYHTPAYVREFTECAEVSEDWSVIRWRARVEVDQPGPARPRMPGGVLTGTITRAPTHDSPR